MFAKRLLHFRAYWWSKSFVSYNCVHNLIDCAFPIIIDDVHYGNFFIGQFLYEPPNLNVFKEQAKRFDFPENEYLDALKKVPIVSKNDLETFSEFIKEFIDIISLSGMKNLKEIENRKLIEESEKEFKTTFELAPTGMAIVNLKGYFTKVNKSFCDMLNYSKTELLKKTFKEINTPRWFRW